MGRHRGRHEQQRTPSSTPTSQTWNETDGDKRRELIAASLGADLWYRDPLLEADGLEAYDQMIAAVQAQFPGLVMRRTSGVDAHRDLVRFTWALGAPDAEPAFVGLDVAKFDGDGSSTASSGSPATTCRPTDA